MSTTTNHQSASQPVSQPANQPARQPSPAQPSPAQPSARGFKIRVLIFASIFVKRSTKKPQKEAPASQPVSQPASPASQAASQPARQAASPASPASQAVDSTEVAHRGRAVLAQRTGFPGEKPSSNRMQVQKDSVRFKKVRTGSTYVQVRAEPMDHPEHAEKVRLPETVRFRFRFFGSANPLWPCKTKSAENLHV